MTRAMSSGLSADGDLQPGVRRTAAQATGDGDGLDDGLGTQVVDQPAPGVRRLRNGSAEDREMTLRHLVDGAGGGLRVLSEPGSS